MKLTSRKLDESKLFPGIYEPHDVSNMTNKELLDHLTVYHMKEISVKAGYLNKLNLLHNRQKKFDETKKIMKYYEKTIKDMNSSLKQRQDLWQKKKKLLENLDNDIEKSIHASMPKGGLTSVPQAKKVLKTVIGVIEKLKKEVILYKQKSKGLSLKLMVIRERIKNARVSSNARLSRTLSDERLDLYKSIAENLVLLQACNRHIYIEVRYKFIAQKYITENDIKVEQDKIETTYKKIETLNKTIKEAKGGNTNSKKVSKSP